MSFEIYLSAKKIDATVFAQSDPALFESWKTAFEQMHPASFTMQKLNLINAVRRKYPLRQTPAPLTPSQGSPTGAPRPVMKPKPKMP